MIVKELNRLILIGLLFLVTSVLSGREMFCPPWFDFKVSLGGNLAIGEESQLKVLIKPLVKNAYCEIKPFATSKEIKFKKIPREKYFLEKGKPYLFLFPFTIEKEVQNVRIGAVCQTEYPVNEIIDNILKVYPTPSPRRDELVSEIESKQGKIAEFRDYKIVTANKYYSYTSSTGICPFTIVVYQGKYFFIPPLQSQIKNSPEGIKQIEKKIKEKLDYIALLKDPAVKDIISSNPVKERREKLKEIFQLSFQKLLLEEKLGKLDKALKGIKKLISDLHLFNITDESIWRDALAFYLYVSVKKGDYHLLSLVEKFLSKKIKNWDLSYVYYDYYLFLMAKGEKARAKEYKQLAFQSNPYLHLARE